MHSNSSSSHMLDMVTSNNILAVKNINEVCLFCFVCFFITEELKHLVHLRVMR